MTNEHDPAAPTVPGSPFERGASLGFTAREHAAIALRVPASGTPWLDDMIRESLRNELAARAMQAYSGIDYTLKDLVVQVPVIVDAMMKESKRESKK